MKVSEASFLTKGTFYQRLEQRTNNEFTTVTGFVLDMGVTVDNTWFCRVTEIRNTYSDYWAASDATWGPDVEINFLQSTPESIEGVLNQALTAATKQRKNATDAVDLAERNLARIVVMHELSAGTVAL